MNTAPASSLNAATLEPPRLVHDIKEWDIDELFSLFNALCACRARIPPSTTVNDLMDIVGAELNARIL